MRLASLASIASFALATAGCVAAEPLSGPFSLPSNVGQNCQNLCAGAGLRMSSIVVMSNAVGCVCEPNDAGAGPAKGGGAAAAGAVTMEMQTNARQQQTLVTAGVNH